LNDSDAEVRLAVIRALGRIGPSAKGAVPVLTRMREDEDSRVRAAVVGALGRIDR
jgi:HEAT repeat protein